MLLSTGNIFSRLVARHRKKEKITNGDTERSLANGNRSSGSNLDDSYPSAAAQEMTVIDRANNNKPGSGLSDPSVPSDLSTLSSCHSPSHDSDGTSNKPRHLSSGKAPISPTFIHEDFHSGRLKTL